MFPIAGNTASWGQYFDIGGGRQRKSGYLVEDSVAVIAATMEIE